MKRKLIASLVTRKRSQLNEQRLKREVSKYFKGLEQEILDNLEEYWSEYQLLQGQINLIKQPITDSHEEYYQILEKYNKREFQIGSDEGRRLVEYATQPYAEKSKQSPIDLQNEFNKDFHTLVSKAEGGNGVELKPIYNKLKKKYKSKVKNRAEFEKLFTNAVQATNTRLYPARSPDLQVNFGRGNNSKSFGYIDRGTLKTPQQLPNKTETQNKQDKKEIKQDVKQIEAKPINIKTNGISFTASPKNPNSLFGTLKWTEQRLLEQVFTASQRTLERVDESINEIITDGYKSGKGINHVRNKIRERFTQLRTWEATRIARTEIHTAHNEGIMRTYEEMNVSYTQWISARDKRVRLSHRGSYSRKGVHGTGVDGEIIPMGGTYSNGLAYPGDKSGPIEEWINCRCSNAPFVMPYGYTAPPGKSSFRESDIVKLSD